MTSASIHREFFLLLKTLTEKTVEKYSKIDYKGITLYLIRESNDYSICSNYRHPVLSSTILFSFDMFDELQYIELYDSDDMGMSYKSQKILWCDITSWLEETSNMDDVLIKLSETNKIRAFESVIIQDKKFDLNDLIQIIQKFISCLDSE